MGNELITKNEIETLVESVEDSFLSVCTSEQKTLFKQEALFALQAISKNDFIYNCALGNKRSVRDAVMNIAATGLTLNPIKKHAYLVPRDGAIHLDISYMGLVHLFTLDGGILWVKSDVVCKNDTFKLNGYDMAPTHEYSPFGDRGEFIGFYCVAKLSNGEYLTEVMSCVEVEAIRNRTKAWIAYKSGKAKSCPWLTDYTEMGKKTVVRRASKMWPQAMKTERLLKAIEISENNDGIDFEKEKKYGVGKEQIKNEALEQKALSMENKTLNYDLQKQQINTITEKLAALTKGKSVNEKGAFMKKHLKISKFTELQLANNEQLDDLIFELDKLVSDSKNVNFTNDDIKF